VAQLSSILNTTTSKSDEPLSLTSQTIAEAYVLSCSVCAAISRHKQFMKSTAVLNFNNYPSSYEYAKESERVIYEFDLRVHPSMSALLTHFFLHTYHSNIPNGTVKGVSHLREAITITHMLNLHEPSFYVNKPSAEAHRYRKIYYQLLVAERFISFETGIPVLLEPKIPIPSLEDEEYSDLLLGFTELAEVFSTTDRQFFEKLHTKVFKNFSHPSTTVESNMGQYTDLSMLQDFLQNQPSNVKKQWIFQLQKKLDRTIVNEKALLDSQKVNIFLSRSWIQSMGWLISSENYLINPNSVTPIDDYFSIRFPLKIANDFLVQTNGLPEYAFESNGPGVSFKLLEVADSLYHFASSSTEPRDSNLAYDQLSTVFKMIVRFKNDMEMPKVLFGKISSFLDMRQLNNRQPSTSSSDCSLSPGSIELLDDDNNDLFDTKENDSNEDTENSNDHYRDHQHHQQLPHQQLAITSSSTSLQSLKNHSLFHSIKSLTPYVDDLMRSPNSSQIQNFHFPVPNNNENAVNGIYNNNFNILTPLTSLSPFYGMSEI
jgi:hypothetical protein